MSKLCSRPRFTARKEQRRGFTLVETAIAALVSSILLMSMAGIWRGMGRSVNTCVAESELSSEARLLMEVFRQDYSGVLRECPVGCVEKGRLVGQMVVGNILRLCFDMPALNGTAEWASPDTVVEYQLVGHQLLRTVDAKEPFVVARNVTRFEPTRQFNATRIEIDLENDGFTRNLVLIGEDDE